MDAIPPPVGVLIQHMRAGKTIDVDTIGRIVGVRLRQTRDSNGSFTFYAAHHVVSGSTSLDVEMRAPVQKGRATSGTLLILSVAGGCTRRKAVEARYGPLTLSQPPRADAPKAEAHWSRREPWGDLSFGFYPDRPDCLTSVVFSIAR